MSEYAAIRLLTRIKLNTIPVSTLKRIIVSRNLREALNALEGTEYREFLGELPSWDPYSLSVLSRGVFLARMRDAYRVAKILELGPLRWSIEYYLVDFIATILANLAVGKATWMPESIREKLRPFPLAGEALSWTELSEAFSALLAKRLASRTAVELATVYRSPIFVLRDLYENVLRNVVETAQEFPEDSDRISALAELRGDMINAKAVVYRELIPLGALRYLAVSVCRELCADAFIRATTSAEPSSLLPPRFARLVSRVLSGDAVGSLREEIAMVLREANKLSVDVPTGLTRAIYYLELARADAFNVILALATVALDLPRDRALSLLIPF